MVVIVTLASNRRLRIWTVVPLTLKVGGDRVGFIKRDRISHNEMIVGNASAPGQDADDGGLTNTDALSGEAEGPESSRAIG